jgi:hypothetical protein
VVPHHLRRLLLGLLLLAGAAPVAAHPGSVAFWHVTVDAVGVRSRIVVSIEDAGWVAGELDAPEHLEASRMRVLAARLLPHFLVRIGDEVMPATVESVRVVEPRSLEIVVRHAPASQVDALLLASTFHALTDEAHRVIARVERGRESTLVVLNASRSRHELPARSTSWLEALARPGSLAALMLAGVEHIVTGYDHLLFLACLLLPGGTWRSRAMIITAFTAAHSVTLGLAALQVVTLPDRFVEAAIAVSVAYVALENLFGDGRGARWPAAFVFGLVHGFGFARMLDVLRLPPAQWLSSVLAFNVGVELGQLAVMALAMPILAMVARQSWHLRAVQFTSAGVLGLAVFWIVERLS